MTSMSVVVLLISIGLMLLQGAEAWRLVGTGINSRPSPQRQNWYGAYGSRRTVLSAAQRKPRQIDAVVPEFSRIVNVAQVSLNREVSCRLLAKEAERIRLAQRFGIADLSYFAANVTIYRESQTAVLVSGSLEARIPLPVSLEPQVLHADFDTKLLFAGLGPEALRIEDAVDYDDEVKSNGDIDVGEIAAQYLSLEL